MLSLSNSNSNYNYNGENVINGGCKGDAAAVVGRKDDVIVRAAQLKDFLKLVEWSSSEEDDWELSPADFEVWQRCFPPESFLAAVDRNDNLMGFCAGVKHGDNIGFIGMYYVKEEYRGCGVGAILWRTVMKYLEGRNLCLAAVPEMVAKYRDRNSFRVISNWRIRIACGTTTAEKILSGTTTAEKIPTGATTANNIPSGTTTAYNAIRLIESHSANPNIVSKVVQYDAKVAGMDRESWCRNWTLNHKFGKCLIAINDSDKEENCRVLGYGQVHEIPGNRLRIGPLYAEDEAVARKLIFGLLSEYPDIERWDLRLSFVADDDRIVKIAQDLGLDTSQDYFELRMHTQYEVPFDNQRMFIFSDNDVNFV